MEQEKNDGKTPELSPSAMTFCGIADNLAGIASKIYHGARFSHGGVDETSVMGELQELQRDIDRNTVDGDPCARAILAWQAHLASSVRALKTERYSQSACEAFWNESQRLQREFDQAMEATSK